jgi:hypothetical protein
MFLPDFWKFWSCGFLGSKARKAMVQALKVTQTVWKDIFLRLLTETIEKAHQKYPFKYKLLKIDITVSAMDAFLLPSTGL